MTRAGQHRSVSTKKRKNLRGTGQPSHTTIANPGKGEKERQKKTFNCEKVRSAWRGPKKRMHKKESRTRQSRENARRTESQKTSPTKRRGGRMNGQEEGPEYQEKERVSGERPAKEKQLAETPEHQKEKQGAPSQWASKNSATQIFRKECQTGRFAARPKKQPTSPKGKSIEKTKKKRPGKLRQKLSRPPNANNWQKTRDRKITNSFRVGEKRKGPNRKKNHPTKNKGVLDLRGGPKGMPVHGKESKKRRANLLTPAQQRKSCGTWGKKKHAISGKTIHLTKKRKARVPRARKEFWEARQPRFAPKYSVASKAQRGELV